MEPLRLIRRSFPDDPPLGTAVSRAILMRVASGELPATARVHMPGRELAFGRQDVVSPHYKDAARAARDVGFPPVERLAGGRAAVFHEGTVAITRANPDPTPQRHTHERFEEFAGLVAAALKRFGIDARVGEIPGEYCPGAYSVNARGAVKLAGVGQRMIRGGAHVGGVVVASGSGLIRDALVPVYGALGLDWRPETAGSVEDELGHAVGTAEVADALVAELGDRYRLEEVEPDDKTLALARSLLAEAEI